MKFNLMVLANCEPTSVPRASMINRQVDRMEQRVGEAVRCMLTVRCMLKEKYPYW
jgi:hypothetical protein